MVSFPQCSLHSSLSFSILSFTYSFKLLDQSLLGAVDTEVSQIPIVPSQLELIASNN